MVTFKEDYVKGKGGKVLYAKGTTHAIHYKLADKIVASGGKADVKQIDQVKFIDDQKKALEKAKKEEKDNA